MRQTLVLLLITVPISAELRCTSSSKGVVCVLALALLLAGFFPSTSRADVYEIPLFLGADDISLQSFVRIQGAYPESLRYQRMQIMGYDDAGEVYGPIWLEVDHPDHPVTFNSNDLEHGNISKGLSRGLGDGSGDWRLELTADDQHLDVRAYVRNVMQGGAVVAPIHQLAASYDVKPGRPYPVHFVPMLNPARNTAQISAVRIFNRKNHYVRVEMGAHWGPAWCDIPPYSALVKTSAELTDLFGDAINHGLFVGEKWSLFVDVLAEPSEPRRGFHCENGSARTYRDSLGRPHYHSPEESPPGNVDDIGVMALMLDEHGNLANLSGPPASIIRLDRPRESPKEALT